MTSRNVLLVADDLFDDPGAVPACLNAIVDSADHVRVVAPLIAGRLAVAADDQAAHDEARARADSVVEALRERGVEADGEYSGSGPYDATVTELLDNDYDLIVVGTTEEGNWREKGLLEKLRSETDVPVSEVVIAAQD